DAESLAVAAADEFARSAAEAIGKRGLFHVALSGGSTPRALYRRLTKAPHRGAVAWESVRFFFGDERCVPPDSERSNFRVARAEALRPARVPASADLPDERGGRAPPGRGGLREVPARARARPAAQVGPGPPGPGRGRPHRFALPGHAGSGGKQTPRRRELH